MENITIHTSLNNMPFNMNKYDSIYISFGSKFNEETVYLNNGDIRQWSNALEQIMPIFIRQKENHSSMIICIDTFSTIELSKNIEKIKNTIIPSICTTSNTDFILYNTESSLKSIELFLSYLINLNIPTEKLMIVNYICFISPNHTEYLMEEKSSKLIYDILSKKESYINQFYQWFGYQKNMYDLIYHYESYKYKFGHKDIIYLLDNILNDNRLNYTNLYMITDCNIEFNKSIYLEIFLKNTIDITSPIEFTLYDLYDNSVI